MLKLTPKLAPLELLPETTEILRRGMKSLRELPVNFDESDIDLFKHELEISIPATRLLTLNNVNISSDGIIFRGGRILAESFNYPHEFLRWASARKVLKFFVRNYAFRTKERLDDKAFWIVDNYGSAYFHWLLDALPRLYTVRDLIADGTLVLPEAFQRAEYILPSLAPFAIGSVRFVKQNRVLHCRKLLVPSHTGPSGQYNEEIVRSLRQFYRSYYGNEETSSPDKIYISRSKAIRRKIVNENEVIDVVKGYGFSVVHLEDYPFAEQVKMMLGARYVVANHGAGLANTLFLPEKSSVFELRKQGDSLCNCYFILASALGLKFYYQLCKAENPNEDGGWANVLVDVKVFRKNLELMLAPDRISVKTVC
jgi:Glycosyltransferase 61